jgi:hypothetical protein
VSLFADDDVVVRGNAERVRHGDNLPRHLDIGARGGWIAERVIVQNVTISATLLLLLRLRAPCR